MNDKKKEHVYISHSIRDGDFVKKLRKSLEQLKIPVWIGSKNNRDNDTLRPEVESAIENAKHTIAVLSLEALNSTWVQNEIQKSSEIEKNHSEGYKTIPVLLPGIKPPALRLLFGKEPAAITIENPENINQYIPDILSALGEKRAVDIKKDQEVPVLDVKPVAELVLELKDPFLKEIKNEVRACASAGLFYKQKVGIEKEKEVVSKIFPFESPFGSIEFDNMSWYLEEYYKWPVGINKTRANIIERKLENLGNMLYTAVFNRPEIRDILNVWKNATDCEHLFSVKINRKSSSDKNKNSESIINNAASQLQLIPWELIHDGKTYLNQGPEKIVIKRSIPVKKEKTVSISKLPVKILLVPTRIDYEYTGYSQYQMASIPLLNTYEKFGKEYVSLTILSPATYPSMIKEIKKACRLGSPYDIIHFYSYCGYNQETGISSISFEDPEGLDGGGRIFVDADEICTKLNKYKIPVVFLENRQVIPTDKKPTVSMATIMIEEGISSVITMTYPGLVSTTTKFLETFYTEILGGSRVGKAVRKAQCLLAQDTYRQVIPRAGNLHLNDWFVPVLYQSNFDPQIFSLKTPKIKKYNLRRSLIVKLGTIAEQRNKMKPVFIGRSKELLSLERILINEPYAMIYGMEGIGKTAVALELIYWLIRTEKYERAVYVNVENVTDVNSVINEICKQLLPESKKYIDNQLRNEKEKVELIQEKLNNLNTIILFDQVENILPVLSLKESVTKVDNLTEQFFALCKTLILSRETRLIFTTREKISGEFGQNGLYLNTLPKNDAIELVYKILNQNSKELPVNDNKGIHEEVENLVDSLNCHTRALALITDQITKKRSLTLNEDLKGILEHMNKEFSREKDKSLYVSIEHSIRRLPETLHDKIHFLSLFHGLVNLGIWARLLKIDKVEKMHDIKASLINVGLAVDKGNNYIQISPVLSFYLQSQKSRDELDNMKMSWTIAMSGLINHLYDQESRNIKIDPYLLLFELKNFLSFLEYIDALFSPEDVVINATKLELLITPLNKPKVVKKIIQVRESAEKRIKKWSKAAFESQRMKVEQNIRKGNLKPALDIAQKLLMQSLEKGEKAYPGAEYDIAMAYHAMGTVLNRLGSSKVAIKFLDQAIPRFKKIVFTGNVSVEHRVMDSINEKASSLMNLGKIGYAEKMYHEGLQICNKINDKRAIAVWKWNLGTCLIKQKKYDIALTFLNEAKKMMEFFKEFESVANINHQIGTIYEDIGYFKDAENAYQIAVGIFNRIHDKVKECASLIQLENIFLKNKLFEEAASAQKRVCAIKLSLNDLQNEGKERTKLANTLTKLNRYDEALDEINRAIECNKKSKNPIKPWFSYSILCFIQVEKKNSSEASQAWKKAFNSYLNFRKAGGSGQCYSVQVLEMFKNGLKKKKTPELVTMIEQYSSIYFPEVSKYFFSKLKAIYGGKRDFLFAKDMELFYMDAVELYLLLEWLIENRI